METWKDLTKKCNPNWKELEPEVKAYHTTQAAIEFTRQSSKGQHYGNEQYIGQYVIDRSWNPVMREEFARLVLNDAAYQKEREYYI